MPPVPTRPKRSRWLRRFAWFTAVVLVILVALAWVAFRNLTTLGLWAANRFAPAWHFEADQLTVGRAGGATIRGLRIHLRSDGSEILAVDGARLEFDWRELRQQHLRAVELDGFRVTGTDAAVEEVEKLLRAGGAGTSRWAIDRIAMRDGLAKVALGNRPSVEAQVDAEFLSLGANASDEKRDSVRLRHAMVRSPSGREIATFPELTMIFTASELSRGHVRRLALERPRLQLTGEETDLLKAGSSDRDRMRWRLDELSVIGADLRVDLPALPMVAATINIEAGDLDSAPNESRTPGRVEIANLTIQPRDHTAKPASLASATIDFTSSGIVDGRLREVRMVRPSVSLDEAWKSVLAGFAGETTPEAATAPPLKVERLIVEGGSADVSLPGLPLLKGSIVAELKDLGGSGPGLQTIELHDLHVGLPDQPEGVFREWLTLPKVRVTFDLADLQERHRLKSIELDRPILNFDRETRAMFSKVGDSKPSPAGAIVAEEVQLRDAQVAFDDLGIGIPPQRFALNLNLTNVPLNDPLSADAAEVQTLELSNINFVSPLDPFVPVLALHSVFIRWTPAGLRDREIEEVVLVAPTLYIGADLFWYMDLVDKQRAAVEPAAAGDPPVRPWRVKRFEATSGKLVLAMAGQSRLTLPMPFESRAENIDFERLSDLRLNLALEVPEQDYENNALDIHLTGVSGKIDFQLPPGADAENVVQTLKVRDIRWRDFRGSDWWLGLTFDQQGIHGDGGGRMCSGDIRAGFTFFLDPRTPWTGWLSGSQLDLKEITDKLSPGRASMTGRATITLAVNGVGGELTRVAGDFRAPGGGELRVTKIDDLIGAIPPEWESTKRDLVVLGLRTLRDFPYRKSTGTFWLSEQSGQLNVRLDGNLGSRELEVNFNPIGDLNRIFMFSPYQP